jgi:hypothetical protein
MLYVISGSFVLVATCAFYWYLLPSNGKVNPLVRNTDVGSMVTILLMTTFCIGVGLVCEGFFG